MDQSVNITQQRFYSINLTNGLIEDWGKEFKGNLNSSTIDLNGGVLIVGQLEINIQIYSQLSSEDEIRVHNGFDGSYFLIRSSINSIVFSFWSFTKAEEIYLVKDLNEWKW